MTTQTSTEVTASKAPDDVVAAGVGEVQRIREAYVRRDQITPVARYSMFNAGAWLTISEAHFGILNALKQFRFDDLDQRTILEIGCGKGHWLRQFIQWGALPEKIVGVDLLEDRVEKTRRLCPSSVRVIRADASELPLEDESFDLVFQAATFTSIFDPIVARRIASEMVRVLKPGGAILWYDFWTSNPNNPDVRGWRRRDIEDLFPNLKIHLRRITLAPPVGRAVANVSVPLYRILSALRLLNTHYLGVFQKPV